MKYSANFPWGDPYILLSFVNTKLRDEYSNLQLLCEDYSEDVKRLTNVLGNIGYSYNSQVNQFTLQS